MNTSSQVGSCHSYFTLVDKATTGIGFWKKGLSWTHKDMGFLHFNFFMLYQVAMVMFLRCKCDGLVHNCGRGLVQQGSLYVACIYRKNIYAMP